LTASLLELAKEVHAPRAVGEQIRRLRDSSAVTVCGGQQAGLFTGPLLTVYKALTVERWAADLDGILPAPVIPCFWLADDDHDFAEVDHVEFPCGAAVHRITYAPKDAPDGRPVGDLLIDSTIDAVFARVEELLPRSEHAVSALGILKEAYAAGTGFSKAFARLWYQLFPHSRLVFVSARDRVLKRLSAPLLAKAAVEGDRLFELYANDTAELVARGYHRQVVKRRDQGFLFYQHGRRTGIRRDPQGLYRLPDKPPLAGEDLHDLVLGQPERFSPNVLLRPVVQNAVFPVLGVVLGPAETAYHAQTAGLHDHFGIPRPAVLPRTSATILGAHDARRIDELGIDLGALARNPDRETARVLASGFPQDLDARFRSTSTAIDAALRALGDELERFDASMTSVLQACARRAGRELDRAAKKAHAVHRRRQRQTAGQIERLAVQLYPCGELQERRFNILWYRALYGPDWTRELHRQWPPGGSDHLLLLPE
jgi:bacillithiol biosynthesis cysteine-adding enzyme BshC